MILNTDLIVNGTARKRLSNDYDTLKADHTKANAFAYYEKCRQLPLSVLLNNADMIYTEPYRGIKFMGELISSNKFIPIDILGDLIIEIGAYIKSRGSQMGKYQKEMYQNVYNDMIAPKEDSLRNSIMLSKFVQTDDTNKDKSLELADIPGIVSVKTFRENQPPFAGAVDEDEKDTNSIMNKFMVLLTLGDEQILSSWINTVYKPNSSNMEDLTRTMVFANVVRRVIVDKGVQELLKQFTQPLIDKVTEISQMTYEKIERALTIRDAERDYKYISPKDAMDKVFMAMDTETEDSMVDKLALMSTLKSVNDVELLFSHFDTINSDDDPLIESYVGESTTGDYFEERYVEVLAKNMELAANIAVLTEWTNDGTPDGVVAKHAALDALSKKKEEEKQADAEKLAKLKEDMKKDKNETDEDDITEKSGDIFGFEDADETYLEAMGLSKKPDSEPVVPKKPNEPTLQKIQHKAIDAKVSMNHKTAEINQTSGAVKNAAKAVISIPEALVNSIKRSISDWDKMDDNKRKEFIIRPGYRKGIYKNLNRALQHGVLFLVNPLLNIVLFIGHHMSDTKDLRIRNELLSELNTEIKVCEEKIQDANSRGDMDQKYKLIRIKDKLTAEVVRVQANSKYI